MKTKDGSTHPYELNIDGAKSVTLKEY